MQKRVAAVVAWLVSLAAAVIFSGSFVEQTVGARALALTLFVILCGLTLWRGGGRLHQWAAGAELDAFMLLCAMAVLACAAGGGIGSLSIISLSLPLIAATHWFGKDRIPALAIAVIAAMMVIDAAGVGRAMDVGSSAMSLLAVGAIVTVALSGSSSVGSVSGGPLSMAADESAAGSKSAVRREEDVAAPSRTMETRNAATIASATTQREETTRVFHGGATNPVGVEGDRWAASLTRRLDTNEPAAAFLEHDVEEAPQHRDPEILAQRLTRGSRLWWRAGVENRAVAEYLLEVRASTEADEAVVWLLNDGDSVLRPFAACSSNQWAERSNGDEKWMALVRWSCEAAVIQCGEMEDRGGYVTAPVAMDGRLMGVLCLRRRVSFDEALDVFKARVSHHATYVARLVSLISAHSASTARVAALDTALEAVRELQDKAPVESPAGSICDAILHVADCDASALIRWDGATGTGTVEAGAGTFEQVEKGSFGADSVAGTACQRGTPFRVPAAADILSRVPLLARGERLGQLGAFSVQPMKRDGQVIGALIAAWKAPTDRTTFTSSSMEVLASVGAHALHTSWQLERVQLTARTDVLTGLSNRRFLDEQLDRVLAESSRYGDPASLIMVDLDCFKAINDTHGHSVGDRVLKHVADTLKDGVRGVDLCARFGGEEMAVLLPRTDLQGAVELAERLRVMVESRPLSIAGQDIRITASFGVASYPLQAPNPAALVSSADGALYRAKAAGRNKVRAAPHNR